MTAMRLGRLGDDQLLDRLLTITPPSSMATRLSSGSSSGCPSLSLLRFPPCCSADVACGACPPSNSVSGPEPGRSIEEAEGGEGTRWWLFEMRRAWGGRGFFRVRLASLFTKRTSALASISKMATGRCSNSWLYTSSFAIKRSFTIPASFSWESMNQFVPREAQDITPSRKMQELTIDNAERKK